MEKVQVGDRLRSRSPALGLKSNIYQQEESLLQIEMVNLRSPCWSVPVNAEAEWMPGINRQIMTRLLNAQRMK